MERSRKVWLVVLAAIGFVYISLRMWHLTDSCLWFDEIFSVHAAEHDWPNLFWFVAQDLIHPPLFYVLLKFWILAGGESLFWVRLLPVLFSIIALFPFYFVCRELKLNYQPITLALFFFAVNGCLIKYAQEVRMYNILLCFSLFSMWLFLRFFLKGKDFWILTFVNILLIYTHYFGWLVVLSEVAVVLILQRIKWRQILLSFGVCLLSFAPWIFTVWRATQTGADVSQNLGWAAKPNLSTLIEFVFDLFEPFYFQVSNVNAGSIYLISVPILLIIIATFVLYLFFRTMETETEKTNFYLLLIFIKTPVILAFLASWLLPVSVWGARHLIIVFAPFLILTAIAITKIQFLTIKIVLVSAICLLIGTAFILQTRRENPPLIWCAWENLARNLDVNQPNKIYVFEDLTAYHFWFAVRESDKIQIVRVTDVPDLIEDKAYFLPRGFDSVQKLDANGITDERFFVAFRDSAWNEKHQPLRILREKGYKIGEPKVFEAQGVKAFLVEVRK